MLFLKNMTICASGSQNLTQCHVCQLLRSTCTDCHFLRKRIFYNRISNSKCETVLERMCITPEKSYAPEVNHRPFTCVFAVGARGVLTVSPGCIPDRIFWPESIWSSHLRGSSRGAKFRCSKSVIFKNNCYLMSFWDIFYWVLHRNQCCLLCQ